MFKVITFQRKDFLSILVKNNLIILSLIKLICFAIPSQGREQGFN